MFPARDQSERAAVTRAVRAVRAVRAGPGVMIAEIRLAAWE